MGARRIPADACGWSRRGLGKRRDGRPPQCFSLLHPLDSSEDGWEALVPLWSQEEYCTKFDAVQSALRRGDIYEMNLCMPWKGQAPGATSWSMFERLAADTKAPHSAYIQAGAWRTLCKPERFLAKRGDKLHSQPIKGTVKRGASQKKTWP